MQWKKIIKNIAIGLLLIFLSSNIINWIKKPDLDSIQLPLETVTLLDGSSYTFKKGKPVVLHFWTSWCHVCKMEASNIEHVSKKYEVLAVAVDSGSDQELQAYMQKHGLHFKVLNDVDGKWVKRFKVEVFPTTFIYNAKGELRFAEIGYTTIAGLLARLKLVE